MSPRASSSQRLLLWIINKLGDRLIKDDRGDSADNRMAVFFTPSGKVSNILLTAYGTEYDMVGRFSEDDEFDQIPAPAPTPAPKRSTKSRKAKPRKKA
jgi:hypothetical protein